MCGTVAGCFPVNRSRDIGIANPEAPAEEQQSFAPEIDNGSADEIEEQDFVEEMTSAEPTHAVEVEPEPLRGHAPVEFEDDMEEESFEPASSGSSPTKCRVSRLLSLAAMNR